MPTVWLRHRALQRRYSCSRNTIDRLADEQNIPPKSFPCGGRAPMWSEELLDHWDALDQSAREVILRMWPDWRGALDAITAGAAVVVAESKPKRRKRKQAKHTRAAASAAEATA